MTFARCAVIALLPLALGSLAGCKPGHHHHPEPVDSITVTADPGFLWQADLYGYSGYEIYEWENPFDDAVVELEAYDFYGALTVDIYDHFDRLVYSRTFFGPDDYRFHSDWTEFGEPGIWLVVISSEDLEGLIDLRLD